MNKETKIILSREEFLCILQDKGITLPRNTDTIKFTDGGDDWSSDVDFPLVISWKETPYSLTYRFNNGVTADINALLEAGKWIEAIKLVRSITGWGLKESKDYVEYKRGGKAV